LERAESVPPRRLLERLRDFLAMAEARSVGGEPWIAEPGRARIRLGKDAQ
jgi:hypothetical protein